MSRFAGKGNIANQTISQQEVTEDKWKLARRNKNGGKVRELLKMVFSGGSFNRETLNGQNITFGKEWLACKTLHVGRGEKRLLLFEVQETEEAHLDLAPDSRETAPLLESDREMVTPEGGPLSDGSCRLNSTPPVLRFSTLASKTSREAAKMSVVDDEELRQFRFWKTAQEASAATAAATNTVSAAHSELPPHTSPAAPI
ncbi:hypothetical protein BDK51DRAFT_29213, partial [Blyttiomyces helicus]